MTQTEKTPANQNQPGAPEPWVLVARIVRPQGRHGELLADILTDFPERFAERRRLFLLAAAAPPREAALEDHWLHKGRVVFKFAGIDSIDDAEKLRGLDVAIPREERAPLEEDAVYVADLIGCRVFEGDREIGEVVDVDRESSSAALLVVRRAGGKEEVLIPFVKAYLRGVDLESRRIEMALPAGLLEVNAPLSNEEREQARRAREAE